MPYEIRSPFSRSAAQRGSQPGTWRKRLLPIGEIDYQGRKLSFDRDYLEDLAGAYNARAYDQVPFQIAPDDNKHTNDPERFRGEVLGMDVQSDGLWITMKPTEAGDRLLTANPKLGVSARIVEDYARSDGQYYPAAIQHVLGTLDPRIPNLGAWERVELSNAVHPEVIIDLSTATFAGETQEGGTMPELNADQQDKLSRLLQLDPDRLGALLDSAEGDGNGAPAGDEMSDDDLVAVIGSMSDDEFGALMGEFDLGELGAEGELAGAGLSNDGGTALELANYRIAETERQMAILQGEHDRQAFENERRRLANLGVPPYITDLARPMLEGTGHTIDLANGQQVDGGLIMRKVLTEFGRATSMLDLSGEIGSSMDEPTGGESQQAVQERDDIVSRFRGQVGI